MWFVGWEASEGSCCCHNDPSYLAGAPARASDIVEEVNFCVCYNRWWGWGCLLMSAWHFPSRRSLLPCWVTFRYSEMHPSKTDGLNGQWYTLEWHIFPNICCYHLPHKTKWHKYVYRTTSDQSGLYVVVNGLFSQSNMPICYHFLSSLSYPD